MLEMRAEAVFRKLRISGLFEISQTFFRFFSIEG